MLVAGHQHPLNDYALTLGQVGAFTFLPYTLALFHGVALLGCLWLDHGG